MQLDISQKEAVLSSNKKVLVVAAPGSGKTTVIINRVAHLIYDKRVNPQNIIVITFTKAAAQNMKVRYKNQFGGAAPFFGTFHALCYKILTRIIGEIKIIDSSTSYRIVKSVLEKYIDDIGEEKIKEALNNISLFKCSFKSIDEFESSIDKETFKECYEEYERYKAKESLIDFDDMQLMVKDFMDKTPGMAEKYKRLFKYILVDEFQDCDDIQVYLLKLFSQGDENSIFAVGDEDQCIYSFRGSKPEYMVNFSKEFLGGVKYYLDCNYRSKKNIVETSKNLIKNNKLRNHKNINYFKKEDGIIKYMTPANENLEGEYIIDNIISEHNKKGVRYSSNAVLYRTNLESRSIIDICIRKKVPFLLLDKEYNFFNHFICQDVIAYLNLSLNPHDRVSFLRVINKPFRYVSKNTLDELKKYAYEDNCFNIIKIVQDMAPFQLKVFEGLSKEIAALNKMSLKSAVSYILTDLGYMDYLREYSLKFKIALSDLEDIVEEFKSSLEGYKTIAMFLAHVSEVKEEMKKHSKNSKEDAVILSTIHGVKGMEFKNVYIINCCEEYIPHKRSVEDDSNVEEERRLFYVAITRAIDGLYLFSPKNIRGKSIKPSYFIDECSINNEIGYGDYKIGAKVSHKTFGEGIINDLKDNTIVIDFDGIIRTFNFSILINSSLLHLN